MSLCVAEAPSFWIIEISDWYELVLAVFDTLIVQLYIHDISVYYCVFPTCYVEIKSGN